MKKIVLFLLCCVLLTGCSNEFALTESVMPTAIDTAAQTETSELSTAPTIEEPAKKERLTEENVPPEPAETTSTTTPTETVSPATTESSDPPTEETTKPDPIITETVIEETDPPPEVNPADIEKLVVEYINQYRTEQGDIIATMLPGLTEVARYRAEQIVTDFSHNSIPDACTVL